MIGCGFCAAFRFAWATAVGLVLMATLVETASAGENWDWYIYNPVATVAAVRGMNRIIDQVQKDSEGALSLRLHLGGSLPINTTNITAAVSDGVVQMGDDGYFGGSIPIAGILRLPMLIRTEEEFAKSLAIMDPYIRKAYAAKDIIVLGQYIYPFQVMFSRKKLTSLGDIKGQKIRVTSPEQGEFVKVYGGVPVTLGAPEVPAALDRGVIDGVLTASSGGGNTWKDLLKYNYRIGLNYFNSIVIMNKAAHDKLATDVKAKLGKAVDENMPWITATMKHDEDELTQKMAAGGMVVTAAQPGEVAEAEKAIAAYWDEWAKARGPEAVEALGKVRAALGR
jgi:TRAP-type transport system periplasmic protein